ncbi:MAG: amidase, partial [Pseudomonadota bacterium]
MSELHYISIADASKRIRSKDLSCAELVSASLDRIAATNDKLHAAITVLDNQARKAADDADAEIADGQWRGPLHGIPIGLKDIYCTAGVLTTCHSPLLADNVPTEDAATVDRLKQAGAIPVAKLSTHEFANGGPSFDLPWPPARNPWNTDHVPAGSSSGSGAAVAAGLVAGAMGSDTGGSIRGPAGVCGIAGFKPSYGLLSRRGIYPLSWTQDHAGPMARTVEDCALMMSALAGYDPKDPASLDIDTPDFAVEQFTDLTSKRTGLARTWYDHSDGADADTTAAVQSVATNLADQGLEVVEIDLPDIRDYHACGRIILLSEAYAIHRQTIKATPENYGQSFRDRVRLGAFISGADYIDALRWRRQLSDAMLTVMDDAKVDVILTANQYGPAETFEDSTHAFPFFRKPYLTMPFNVTGMPA